MKIITRVMSCIAVLAIVVAGWIGLEHILRPTYSDNSLALIESFHKQPENSIDVIVYGSSHSWRGVNTRQLTDDYGINAYNYSCMWQHINTTDLFVDDSFRTQKPKLALIEVGNIDEVLTDTDIVGEVYYTRKIKSSDTKKKYLQTCFGRNRDRYITYYLPLCTFHSGWEDLSQGAYGGYGDAIESLSDRRGFFGFDNVTPLEATDDSEYWQEPLKDGVRDYLDHMISLCEANGTKVILFTVPYYDSEYMYRDALKEYVQDKDNVEYINFFEKIDELSIDGAYDFSDTGHLNNSGAGKVTAYLGEYIRSNYDLGE